MSETDQLSRGDLRDAAVSGIRWIAVGRVIAEASALVGSVAVARLLSPAEFGHAAPAAFVFALAASLPIGSFGSYLVQAERIEPIDVRTSLTLSILAGVLLTLLTVALAPVWGLVLPDESVALVALAAPCFLFFSLASMPLSLLQRDLDFQRTSINEVVAFVPATMATIGAAAAGLGGVAIVMGFLVQAALMCAQALYWRRPPLPGFSSASAGRILRFGGPASITGLLHTSQRNVAVAILSARLPASSVGLYWRAQQLAVDYQGKATGIIMRLLFPLLSRAASVEDLRAVRAKMVSLHAVILFPPLTLLAVLAPILVPFIYGPAWSDAVVPTQILVITGYVFVLGTGTGPVLMALGRPRPLLIYNVFSLIGTATVLMLASTHGLTATCIAISAWWCANLVAGQYLMMKRIAGIPLSASLVRDVVPAAASSLALAVVAWPCATYLPRLGAPDAVTLAVSVALGLVAYATVLRRVFSRTWHDITDLGRRVRPARRGRATSAPAQAAEPPTSPA